MKSKFIQITLSLAIIILTGCNNNSIGSNGTTDNSNLNASATGAKRASSLFGAGAPTPLSIVIESHNSSPDYLSTTDTPAYSMLNITNNSQSPISISAAPILDNSTDFSLVSSTSLYPANTTICNNGTTLNFESSCLLLIKGNSTGVSQISTTLTIRTPTYTYAFNVSRKPILYIGGNFSSVKTSAGNSIVASNNGKCSGNKACMLIGYDPASNTLTKLAETDDEIYGLAVDSNGFIIAGGAFTQLATTKTVLNTSGKPLPSTLIAQINPIILSASNYAIANQALYAIGASPATTNKNNIYLSGAFNSVISGDNKTTITSTNSQCMVAQNNSSGTWGKTLDSADGYINSIATSSAGGGNDTLIVSGMFEKINGTTLPNYTTGIVSCVNGNCGNAPLSLAGRANVVANSITNQMITSGEFNTIPGLSGLSHGDMELNGAGIGGWGKINTSTGDGSINTILPIGTTYYTGGNFTTINNSSAISGASDCSDNFNSTNLCTLATVSSSSTSPILGANSSINAIAGGMAITVQQK